MNKTGLNGSAILHALALSPVALATAGSTTASNLANFGWLTTTVAANSAALSVYVQRSATSNGTFNTALSLTSVASGLAVRSMPLESSAVFYRVAYNNGDAGSVIAAIQFQAAGARRVPVTQTNATVYSDVIAI